MKIAQCKYDPPSGWNKHAGVEDPNAVQLVMLFGHKSLLKERAVIDHVMDYFSNAEIVGCSTSGEIFGRDVYDGTVVGTAVTFESSSIQVIDAVIESAKDSYQVGRDLVQRLPKVGLKHICVFSEGLNINGTELSKGLNSGLPAGVAVTGGLAGDEANFQETVVVHNRVTRTNLVVIIGFYGESLQIGYGSKGGWVSFGVDREITKSDGNILYELDNQPALSLYKKYLGGHAAQLPASALLFPLSLRIEGEEKQLVRTILGINEGDGSMTFAGDMPVGARARLMCANYEKLIDGANGAAGLAMTCQHEEPELALLISCVGRKLVLKQRTEEEIESVDEILGGESTLAGFYSYGEICPSDPESALCDLHNQTMTITTFRER